MRGITVEATSGDGLVTVQANAAREITNISIDAQLLQDNDPEALEDLLMVAVNRVLEEAAAKEASESQSLLQNLLPPGLGGMFGG